jgi:GR25 family glycosyltransferase involved in LPS biosynthesis
VLTLAPANRADVGAEAAGVLRHRIVLELSSDVSGVGQPQTCVRVVAEFANLAEISMIPVWVMNLARDTERRALMTTRLDRLGIRHEIVPGVDGRALGAHKVAEYNVAFRRGFNRDITRGELGCALAHLDFFRRIANGPDPLVCTMEDDIGLSEDIPQFLQEETLRTLPPFDVLRLFATGMRRHQTAWKVATTHNHDVVVPLRSGWGTQAQIISRNAAALLAEWPIIAPIDGIYHDYPPRGLRIMEVRPSLVERRDLGSNTAGARSKPAKKSILSILRAESYRLRRKLATRRHFIETWGLRGLIGLMG